MTLKPKKREQINKVFILTKSIGLTAKLLRLTRNTVKKYLRLAGLLSYSYSSLQHTGPPSYVHRSPYQINLEQNRIKELTHKLHMANELGGNLRKELDKKNLKDDQKDDKIKESDKKITERTDELETVKREKDEQKKKDDKKIQDLTQDNNQKDKEIKQIKDEKEQLKQSNTQLTTEREAEKREKEGLQKTVDDQKDIIRTMTQDHQRELEEQKTKIEEKKNHEILEIKKNFLPILEKSNNEVAKVKNNYNLLKKEHEETTEENRQLKLENWSLNLKQSNSFLKYTIVYLAGAETGLLAHHGAPVLKKLFFSPKVEYKKNTGTPIIPILTRVSIQPDIQSISSGMIPDTNTARTLCSGTYPNTSGNNTGAEYALVPNQHENIIPADSNNDVTFVTDISGNQSQGAFYSSHFETIGFTSQDTTPVQIPSPFQIPINYYFIPLPSPLPDDLSKIYPMNKLRRLKGTSFEDWNEKLFRNRGCPVERLSYGNYCGDLIVTLNGVPTLIECKQKPKVGVDTIQRTYAAKDHYRYKAVTHCIVITTGEFTRDAVEEAQNLGVELWDDKRLLEELYKHQFFYLPENPEDYDPDK